MRWLLQIAALALWGAAASALRAEAKACSVVPPSEAMSINRPVTTSDLLALRDFGATDSSISGKSAFGLSPDGRRVAVVLRQGHPNDNVYCQGLILIATDGSAPRQIDDAGPLILARYNNRGLIDFPSGSPQTITPRWSPDGRSLAYLRSDGASVRVRVVSVSGSSAKFVSPPGTDVDDFQWSADGTSILFSGHRSEAANIGAIAREGLTGFHYDNRFWPLASDRPFSRDIPLNGIWKARLSEGTVQSASDIERSEFGRQSDHRPAPGTLLSVQSPDGAVHARSSASAPELFVSPTVLHVLTRGGETLCSGPNCSDIVGLWRWGERNRFVWLNREGVAGERLSLYAWSGGSGRIRRILSTSDLLIGCQLSAQFLICAREGTRQPRRIDRIDLRSGASQTLLDPNPSFSRLVLGSVRRLHWTNIFGVETFGDLVLPPDWDGRTRLPLIVVQYDSHGFLRGGTGDEYPIYPMAAAGFAVLSFQKPPDPESLRRARTIDELERLGTSDWTYRRNVESSLETVLGLIERSGISDPTRVGITGLSDGASTAIFALIHSRLFSAAALSTCCEEANTDSAMIGPSYRDALTKWGYPALGDAAAPFWAPISLSATQLPPVPLLIQASSDEFRLSLVTLERLKRVGYPFDLYVFPDEHHVKWQPAHRAAIYQRSIDWFNFWLLGRLSPSPIDPGEYSHWAGLKAERAGAPAVHDRAQISTSSNASTR